MINREMIIATKAVEESQNLKKKQTKNKKTGRKRRNQRGEY